MAALSLSQEISSLCDPTPSFNEAYDWSDNDDSKAKLCPYKEEEDSLPHGDLGKTKTKRKSSLRRDPFETDPKYAGKPVSRKALGEKWETGDIADIDQEDSDDSEGLELDSEGAELDDDSSEGTELDHNGDISDFEEAELDLEEIEESEDDDKEEISPDEEIVEKHSKTIPNESSNVTNDNGEEDLLFKLDEDMTAKLRESAAEDIEKGKAVKNQLSVWDGLLEGRIRLQKVLPLVNRLPQGEMMEVFKKHGKDALTEKLKMTHSELSKLLDSLLDLQKTLLIQNTQTRHIITGESSTSSHSNEQDDEEIPSDFSDEEAESESMSTSEATPTSKKHGKRHQQSIPTTKKHKNFNEWVESREKYIEEIHERFNPYRNETISKWNEKLKLASGKMTSKAFQHFDRSIMAHIEYILNDKQRLRKRTQLKRSSYTVIGQDIVDATATKREKTDTPPDDTPPVTEQLKEYDEEIFDDSDFYHQLLKELIDRKTSHHDIDNPIEMGRQWLELQKLRTKVKKKVDTKASKGRKLRYEVHPKLTNFMTPIDRGSMSNSARNDLFSSLFGSRHSLN